MSDAISSKGTQIHYAPVGETTFTQVAEVKSISGPNMSKDQIEVTHLNSPGSYREYLDSFKDGGEVTLECNFEPTQHEAILTDFNSDTPRDFKIVWGSSGFQWTFMGFYKSVSSAAAVGDALKATIVIKVTGSVSQGAVV